MNITKKNTAAYDAETELAKITDSLRKIIMSDIRSYDDRDYHAISNNETAGYFLLTFFTKEIKAAFLKFSAIANADCAYKAKIKSQETTFSRMFARFLCTSFGQIGIRFDDYTMFAVEIAALDELRKLSKTIKTFINTL